MVEHRSSKPYAWVRFLLSLTIALKTQKRKKNTSFLSKPRSRSSQLYAPTSKLPTIISSSTLYRSPWRRVLASNNMKSPLGIRGERFRHPAYRHHRDRLLVRQVWSRKGTLGASLFCKMIPVTTLKRVSSSEFFQRWTASVPFLTHFTYFPGPMSNALSTLFSSPTSTPFYQSRAASSALVSISSRELRRDAEIVGLGLAPYAPRVSSTYFPTQLTQLTYAVQYACQRLVLSSVSSLPTNAPHFDRGFEKTTFLRLRTHFHAHNILAKKDRRFFISSSSFKVTRSRVFSLDSRFTLPDAANVLRGSFWNQSFSRSLVGFYGPFLDQTRREVLPSSTSLKTSKGIGQFASNRLRTTLISPRESSKLKKPLSRTQRLRRRIRFHTLLSKGHPTLSSSLSVRFYKLNRVRSTRFLTSSFTPLTLPNYVSSGLGKRITNNQLRPVRSRRKGNFMRNRFRYTNYVLRRGKKFSRFSRRRATFFKRTKGFMSFSWRRTYWFRRRLSSLSQARLKETYGPSFFVRRKRAKRAPSRAFSRQRAAYRLPFLHPHTLYRPLLKLLDGDSSTVLVPNQPIAHYTSSDCRAPSKRPLNLWNQSSFLKNREVSLLDSISTWATVANSPELFKYLFYRPLISGLSYEQGARLVELEYYSIGGLLRGTTPVFHTNLSSMLVASNYTLKKHLLRRASSAAFAPPVSLWYYRTLVKFIEACSGRQVSLHLGPFLENSLTFEDRAKCRMWSDRITSFQKSLGHRIFVNEGLRLVALSIRLKDPTFLSNWIRAMLDRISFWKIRDIFRFVKFLFKHIFKPNFEHFQFKGLKLSLKGKISVAGNARTRTLFMRVGNTSHSSMDNKIAYDLNYVHTFTGILGFKLWFFF